MATSQAGPVPEVAANGASSRSPHSSSLMCGTWDVTITTPNHPEWTSEWRGLIAFTSDGITISSNAADISIGLGSWYPGPDDTFSLFRRSNFIDATGVIAVLQTTHHGRLISPQLFRAVGFGEMYDMDGKLMYEIPDVHLKAQRY